MNQPLVVKTISPIVSPLKIKLGIDYLNKTHNDFWRRLAINEVNCLNVHKTEDLADYDDIETDTRDIRLFVWQSEDFPALRIHLFPNSVAIAELDMEVGQGLCAADISTYCNGYTKQLLNEAYQSFYQDVVRYVNFEQNGFLTIEEDAQALNIQWTARSLLITKEDCQQESMATLLTQWLKDTQYPEDAQKIIDGQIDHSLTWLNYVVVDHLENNEDSRISTMVLAQYYYCAQENCNKMLKFAIDNAYNANNMALTEKQLSHSRVVTRLHLIDFNEHIKYLNRYKRRLLNNILASWEFTQVCDNGQRMIEVCSSRLEEVDNKRRERSTVMTDLLLVTLSFFAVFELSLYLTEFSREMMSRPALDYNDSGRSLVLEFIANVDVDLMVSMGFGLTFALVVVYILMKGKS